MAIFIVLAATMEAGRVMNDTSMTSPRTINIFE